ncbi:MAG: hypothetical protein HQL50_05380 [Magnetococcales bacterium]|nr:hypothetical protein [Magnetococcales bacterium]
MNSRERPESRNETATSDNALKQLFSGVLGKEYHQAVEVGSRYHDPDASVDAIAQQLPDALTRADRAPLEQALHTPVGRLIRRINGRRIWRDRIIMALLFIGALVIAWTTIQGWVVAWLADVRVRPEYNARQAEVALEPPPGVTLSWHRSDQGGTLTATGESTAAWRDRFRVNGVMIPAVTAVDLSGLTVIETASERFERLRREITTRQLHPVLEEGRYHLDDVETKRLSQALKALVETATILKREVRVTLSGRAPIQAPADETQPLAHLAGGVESAAAVVRALIDTGIPPEILVVEGVALMAGGESSQRSEVFVRVATP